MNSKNKTSINGLELIKKFEGLRLNAYKCSGGIWTIGYGNTFYKDNTRVKEGDIITLDEANELLSVIVSKFEKDVLNVLKTPLNNNQFDALISFTFNLGIGNLSKSSLLKKINTNPNDPSIKEEFHKWNKAGGKVLNGLTKRRQEEAELYFKK